MSTSYSTTTRGTSPNGAAARTGLTERQAAIIAELGVGASFDAAAETERSIAFLADYLRGSGATGFVLGISGGVDSTTSGRLAQLACERVGAKFTAVRLPYGAQADEDDAQRALDFIRPDEVVTVNIKDAVDALAAAVTPTQGYASSSVADFIKGNIKARIRMTAQYALAGERGALVLGTDHSSEGVMGFFTKFGDGAYDLSPLGGLTKGRVRAVADFLGAPAELVAKTPTADLEDERPGLPDEVAYGVTYAQIDAYLEGRPVSDEARAVIEAAHRKTAHKRALPAVP